MKAKLNEAGDRSESEAPLQRRKAIAMMQKIPRPVYRRMANLENGKEAERVWTKTSLARNMAAVKVIREQSTSTVIS